MSPTILAALVLAVALPLLGCSKKPLFNDANNAPIRGANLLVRTAANEEMCMDAEGNGAELSRPLQLFHCHGRENQRWTFAEQSDGSSEILCVGGLCMDVQGQRTSSGSPLQLYTCAGTPNQKFRHNIDGRLQELQTGKCLTVAELVDKSPLFIDTCSDKPADKSPGQIWVISPR
jgi:hypothetical protein